MDNDNLSKIPVSELTPENLNSLKGDQVIEEPPKPKPKKPQGSNRLPLLIAGAALLVGIGIALFFIFRKPAEPETPTQEEPTDELEVVWSPSEGSTDPSQEFYEHHQSIINNPETTSGEKFTSTLEIANLYTATSHFAESEALLDSIPRDSLTTEEKFRLYSVYRYLYEQSGNSAAAEEYAKLVDEALNAYWETQPDISEE